MSSAREKDQLDFDLERFIEMFDEALTSNDDRVVNALRQLMMMVILTKSESRDGSHGPLKRLFDDQSHILRRLERIETEMRSILTMNTRYGTFDKHFPDVSMQSRTASDYQSTWLGEALKNINGPGAESYLNKASVVKK